MITFCIATAKNERSYIELLLKSLQNNTDIAKHEVLVFVDSDNQNTYEMLCEYQKRLPNLRIYNNTSKYPIGSQRNVSLMFNAASNDIMCYLQSDMVVGKDLDKYILQEIKEDIVLSLTRIEPPLHPPSPDKITKDFGRNPEEFRYDDFNKYVDSVIEQNLHYIESYFAPFAIYKSTWFDKLGGFDTQFRCSREDSDFAIRMGLNNIRAVQTWRALVYHFTCVSSRGKDWFLNTNNAKYENELQQQADVQEIKRFIRKWGYFGHHYQPKYDIALKIDVDKYVDFELLMWIEPFFYRIIVNDLAVARELKNRVYFDSYYYSNLKWKYSLEHWVDVECWFHPTDFDQRIINYDVTSDVEVSCKYSELAAGLSTDVKEVITNINSLVHINEEGTFVYGPLTIQIKNKRILDPPKKVEIPKGFFDSKFIFK